MVFSSYNFILIFLPVVLLLYFGMAKYVPKRVQHVFLIIASLVFYGYSNPSYLWIIISSIIVNYSCAIYIEKTTKLIRKSVFIVGILFNVGLLGYYKYYDFFIENFNIVFHQDFTLKHIILPLGISFFTFQQIAFLISIFKKRDRVTSFLDYALLIAFFPQLVAGPIVFYGELVPQFGEEKKRYFNYDNFAKGLFIFSIGLFKKAVIADSIALFANNGFDVLQGHSFGTAWATSLSYTMQIYFDFSGYSEMAIGLGKMFNLDIPMNFNSPYKSKSIQEFWKRWHMTLGRSLAILIYFPLGGNRNGMLRTCMNLFAVFLVSGIWHGAAWTFIVWGALHGLMVVFERIFHPYLEKIPSIIRVAFTFMYVNLLWVLFRATSFESAMNIIKNMFSFEPFTWTRIGFLAQDGIISFPSIVAMLYVILFILILMTVIFTEKKNSIQKYSEFVPSKKNVLIIAVLFSLSILHLSRASIFIYFNF